MPFNYPSDSAKGCLIGRLVGKTAVVIGGGQTPGATIGNGHAVAVKFACEGARVLVVDRNMKSAEQTVEHISTIGGDALAYQADITNESDCAGIVAEASKQLGSIDILHNNVGVVVAAATESTSKNQWVSGFQINLFGPWTVCRYALPVMRKQGHGAVINISSLAGLVSGSSAYSVAKSGLNAMTRGLALEYAPHNIRINAIAPGMIDTPIGVDRAAARSRKSREEVSAGRAASVPMRRQGTAWDIASAAVFLSSDDANYITGAILPVDGGSSLL